MNNCLKIRQADGRWTSTICIYTFSAEWQNGQSLVPDIYSCVVPIQNPDLTVIHTN